jgi:hypothetical protein
MAYPATAGEAFRTLVRDRALNPAEDRTEAHAAGEAIDAWFAAQDQAGPLQIVRYTSAAGAEWSIVVQERTYKLPRLRSAAPVTIHQNSISDCQGTYWTLRPVVT